MSTVSLPRNPLDPNLYKFGDPALNGYPHDLFELLRDEHPCVNVALDFPGFVDHTWVLSRHADVVTVDRDPALFTSTSGHTHRKVELTSSETEGMPSMITMDGADHIRLRRLVSRAFTPRVVKVFEQNYRTMAQEVVAKAVARGTFDLIEDVAVDLPAYAVCTLLGVPSGDHRQVAQWTNTLVSQDEEYSSDGRTLEGAMRKLGEYALELAELRRREPGDDVVSELVHRIGTPDLSEDEYVGMVFLLAAAGNETTRTNIGHAVNALLRHPDQLRHLRQAGEQEWDVAVEELTRYATPIVGFRRIATDDVEFHGQTIPRGDSVTMLFAAANFDESVFPNARALDLHRSPNPHVSFGAGGRHFCLGAHLARLETKLVLQELLRQFDSLTIVEEPAYARDSTIRGIKHFTLSGTPAR
jgi:cholest-4-en-3-one 26-monooxygenase